LRESLRPRGRVARPSFPTMLPTMGGGGDEFQFGEVASRAGHGPGLTPSLASQDGGGSRFIDQVRLPGMDTTGEEMVEMDEYGDQLPSMGGYDNEPYWGLEEEEEDLIDCDVEQEKAAVNFYAAAGGCPAHLSVMNYDEFVQTVASEVSIVMRTLDIDSH